MSSTQEQSLLSFYSLVSMNCIKISQTIHCQSTNQDQNHCFVLNPWSDSPAIKKNRDKFLRRYCGRPLTESIAFTAFIIIYKLPWIIIRLRQRYYSKDILSTTPKTIIASIAFYTTYKIGLNQNYCESKKKTQNKDISQKISRQLLPND